MRKLALLWTAVLLLGLVAGCRSEPAPPTATPTTAPTPTAAPTIPAASPTSSGPATCQVSPSLGEPLQGLPPVTAEDRSRGPEDAPITLIEYSDFQ